MAQVLSVLMKIFKLKYILLFLALFITFVFVLFPTKEINDFATSLVLKQTQNQVYVTFDNLDLSVLSGLSASLEQVELETAQTNTIRAKSISVKPSIGALLQGQPSGSAQIEGVFGGNLNLNVGVAKKSGEATELMTPLQLDLQSVKLKDLMTALKINIPVFGVASLSAKGELDTKFIEQPDFEFSLSAKPLGLENFDLQTQMGPLPLPKLSFKNTQLKGRLVAGKLHIDESALGAAGDAIQGSVKGSLDLRLVNQNGKVVPQIGGYSFDVKLNVAKRFVEDNSFMFLAISSFKASEDQRETFKFKVSATNPMLPPSFGALR